MGRKKGIKDKIGRMTMERPGVNRKILTVKKSLDEVKHILEADKHSSKK